MFFPRGGSAQVARSLAEELPLQGWEVTILSGSLPGLGDANVFYKGLDVVAVDFEHGDAPHHPSFEDRPGARDVVFARVDDAGYERHVHAWCRALDRARAADADVLHLHHLTPINEAAARVAPHVPIVGHLHGTELLMLEKIAAGPPASWTHAADWQRRMRRWARRCERILVLTERQVKRARALLDIPEDRFVVSPNGFDPERFCPRPIDRRALWHHHLVEDPRGWKPNGEEGSVRYATEEVDALAAGTIFICVGRFTEVKRTGVLIRAFARAQPQLRHPASLVLLGGYPGEWEGEHPLEVVEASGAEHVFLAGWHGHDLLPDMLSASDVVALASVREQFGLALVEGMACGLPAIGVNRWGPAEIVTPGQTGWLVEPDDELTLAEAIVAAVNDPEERRRRGAAAMKDARARFSWPALAGRLTETLTAVAAVRQDRLAGSAER
jgi:glycosyltransferase involved in cell wall biosynthesis